MNELVIPTPGAQASPTATKVRFGIILDVNGTTVPVTTDDLSNALGTGVDFTLQNPVPLGSITAFATWVDNKFGVSLPAPSALPSPLDKVVGAIENMQITVEKAHIHVPGNGSATSPPGPVLYTLEVNGTFAPEISLVDGQLGIEGMVFGFSNEPGVN